MSGKEKQSLKSRMFTHLLNAAVTAALRPKIVWEDRSLKKLAGSEPFIFVANHTHHFDGVFAAAAAKKFKPYSVVSRKWYDKAGYGKFIKLTKSIPIDLDSLDASWFQTGEKLISQGESILIFPEGAVAREGKMLGFKSGAGLLSAKTGARIIPIAIYGRYKMFSASASALWSEKRSRATAPKICAVQSTQSCLWNSRSRRCTGFTARLKSVTEETAPILKKPLPISAEPRFGSLIY